MARPRQEEMPIEGPGVGQVKDKKLERLGYEFIETRDQKAELATQLGEIETKIFDRMAELELKCYRFGDQILEIKDGKRHCKVKTVKTENEETGEEAPPES